MIEQLPAYIAQQIEQDTGIPCSKDIVEVKEDISSDSLSLYIAGRFISAFELFDEETVEDMAVELLDGQLSDIREVLIDQKQEGLTAKLEKQLQDLEKWASGVANLEDIDCYIKSVGYQGKHWELEEELAFGWPIFVLEVSAYKSEIEFSYRLSLSENSVEDFAEGFKKEFQKYIKTIDTNKQ